MIDEGQAMYDLIGIRDSVKLNKKQYDALQSVIDLLSTIVSGNAEITYYYEDDNNE